MCDFFQVIKNTFFCYANISQPYVHTTLLKIKHKVKWMVKFVKT